MQIKTYFILIIIILFCSCRETTKVIDTDILVIGGSTSGVCAGIQAARLSVNAIIVEESQWLGGMLTASGVSATDGNHRLKSGLWNEFREKLIEHYGSEKALATGWVSNTQFEPHIGDIVFKDLAQSEKSLRVIYGYFIHEILVENNRITGAVFKNNMDEDLLIRSKITIDATDLGDGLALAGAGYDLGMESNSDTGESCAPPLANNIIQDLTWVAILQDFGQGTDHTINKPENYDKQLFLGSCSMTIDSILIDCEKMLSYGKLPNNKYLINWPRHGNDIYLNVVEMNRELRLAELEKARQRTLEFVYFIQTELGYKNLGLAENEFPSADKLPIAPYHREGRRLKGVVRMTANHAENRYSGAPLYRTGISVGDYPLDHHHLCNPKAPKIIFPQIASFNIPLGALIPETLDGLIVSDKAISVSNIMNGATRLQPCVMLTGQAAGALAAVSVKHNQNVRDINIREVQQVLLDSRAYLMPLTDLSPDDSDFNPIQRVTASGLLKVKGEPFKWANNTWFFPDSLVTVKEFTQGLHEINPEIDVDDNLGKVTLDIASKYISDLGAISDEKIKKIWNDKIVRNYDLKNQVSKRELAVLLDEALKPFENYPVDFQGYFITKNM